MAAATVVAISAQGVAQAAPKLTLKQATTEVGTDRKAADAATEKYDSAQGTQQSMQQKANALQEEIARQQASINQELSTLSAVAAAQYRTDAIDPTVQMILSSDPTKFLDEASAQGELDASQQAALSQLKGQEAVLAREKAEASKELGQQQALLTTMQATKAAAVKKLKAAQSIMNSLTPVERATVNNNTGAGGGSISGSGSISASQVDLSGISAAARTAVEAALSRIGDPYDFGAAGPNAFDCSGLVMWAYAQAGISLPHYSYADESVGTAVSASDIEVGDIVVVEDGAHVGIYVGNGDIVNAPEYGIPVSIMPIKDFGELVAIRRV